MTGQKERQALRTLAKQWMDFAGLPVMGERRRQWEAVKNLKPEKPVILVETCMLPDYIEEKEMVCEDPYLRNVEKSLFEIVRHAGEIGDDLVVDPFFRIPWVIRISDYGVPLTTHHARTSSGNDLGYSFNFPIQSAEDVLRLKLRSRAVDRAETLRRRDLLQDLFGDILPVIVSGYDYFNPDTGYSPWLGNLYCGLTMDLFKLIGNDNLLVWVYDEPELIHRIMKILRDDRIAHYKWMEEEGLLYVNTDTWNPCPGSYGFVSDLPGNNSITGAGNGGNVRLTDCWAWADSQETEPISPSMFGEFFLPYIAELCGLFGLTYYGCCEGVDDRFEYIRKAVPNLRAVSVSGWSDLFKTAELLGKDYVYSRKPVPAYISGDYPDWSLLEKDVRDTVTAAKGCSLEFCYRDIYTINGDRARLRRWVDMTRALAES
ncbi:MAG: hypothetical protein E4H36_12195 [Spirochaetales bacterium]|nr:MAG: hypothetical protein E4H36_12195 [Spirochaetales bacterium]